MAIHQVLYICLVLLAVFFPLPLTGQPPPNIDFYQLVFQWPGTLCIIHPKKCVPNMPRDFTLHGLWPDDSARSKTPSMCRPLVPFHNPIAAQAPDLQKDWPSVLTTKSNVMFWNHEWVKHGSCAPGLTQDQYFALALRLFRQFDIKWLLNQPPPAVSLRIGVHPNTLNVSAEIFAKLGVHPILRFHDDLKTTRKLLKEVVICYDGQRNISCPSARPNINPPQHGDCYFLP